jgi:alpha-beta hydrolase superfamily lysophospholipase
VHGLGEHSGRYAHVARALREWGWAPVSYDQRGHGHSAGKRGVIRTPDDLITDLATVVDTVRPADGTPFLLLGHSMGGNVVAHFVADAIRPVDGLILSSPALAGELTTWQAVQLRLALAFAPTLAIPNGFDPSTISHDPEVVRAYREDPLVHDRVCGRLVRSLFDGGAHVLSRAHAWVVPTLLMWAGDDHLVAPEGSVAFARRAPTALVEAHPFPSYYHEILNELEPAPVFEALRRWLDSRFPVARG